MSENLKNAIRAIERGEWYPVDLLNLEEIRWLKYEYGDKLQKTSAATANGPRGMLYICW